MFKNGCGSSAPFWMIRIVPPCSTANRRPLPSLGCSRSRGEFNPETTSCKLIVTGEGGVLLLLPPQLIAMLHASNAAKPNQTDRLFFTPHPYDANLCEVAFC